LTKEVGNRFGQGKLLDITWVCGRILNRAGENDNLEKENRFSQVFK